MADQTGAALLVLGLALSRQGAEILLDQGAIGLGDFTRARQLGTLAASRVGDAAQPELELLQPVDDVAAQGVETTLGSVEVLVPVAHPAQDIVEVGGLDALLGELLA